VGVEYRTGAPLDLDEALDLSRASTLGERRPVDDRERMARMLGEANLVITAWDRELPVGIARSLTDWSYVTYLSDLAVRTSHQRIGIGRELIERTRAAAPEAGLVLLAAPASVGYYPKVGLTRHEAAFYLPPPDSPATPST
jgi:predicted N-acetyltransferase YhbS